MRPRRALRARTASLSFLTDSAPFWSNTSAPALLAPSSDTGWPPQQNTTRSLMPSFLSSLSTALILVSMEANSPDTTHAVTLSCTQRAAMSSGIMPSSTISVSNPSMPRRSAIRFLPSVWMSRVATTAFPRSGLGMPSASRTS